MTKTFAERCKMFEQCLPDASYRDLLKELHAEMLAKLAEQSAPAQEPWAWLFQHEETGLTQCVDTQQVEWGFEKNNPRWQKIAPLYTTAQAQPAQPDQPEQIDPMRLHVEKEATKAGWVKAEGEGAYEYMQRQVYARGFADALEQPAQQEPLTDEQIDLFINGRGDEDDDDYVEPTGDGFGLTDADLVRLARRVEAAHGITKGGA